MTLRAVTIAGSFAAALTASPALADENAYEGLECSSIENTAKAHEKFGFKTALRIKDIQDGAAFVVVTRNTAPAYWMLERQKDGESCTLAEGSLALEQIIKTSQPASNRQERAFYNDGLCASPGALPSLLQKWDDTVLGTMSGDNHLTGQSEAPFTLTMSPTQDAGAIYAADEQGRMCILAQGPLEMNN